MFGFPSRDSVMGQIWFEKCNILPNDERKKLLICENHFASSDILQRKLKVGAVPIISNMEVESDVDMVEPEKINYSSSVAECCSKCESYAKSADFHRRKYYALLDEHKKLKKNKEKKKKSIFEIIDGVENVDKKAKDFCKLLLHTRPKEYSADVKELAQNIFYFSQSTYQFLRNNLHFNLPHISTVNRWAPIKTLQPGSENTALPFIKIKCSQLSTKEQKNMILLVDEMALRRELRYNQKLDLIDGFEHVSSGRNNSVVKYLCCFMLKSMFSSFGVILNYFGSKKGLSAIEVKNLIVKNLNMLSSFGIKIKVITCDQASTNRKCFADLGVSVERPFFLHNSDKVFCLFDFPHLLKSLRNGWMTCDLATLDGKVSFKIIRELWESEVGATTKMCPKLTRQHIYPNTFEKMKVKLATQVFSHTVEAAIQTVVDTRGFKTCTKEEAAATACFIGKINRIFDCMNSSSLHSNNIYKSALQKNSKSLEFLEYFKNYLEYMHFVNTSKTVYFLDGMKQTVNAVLMLVGELFTDNEVFFLMTRLLNQDKLENAFSVLRQKGGNNTMPSVAEVNNILSRLMSTRIIKMSPNSNYEDCYDTVSEDLAKDLTNIVTQEPTNEHVDEAMNEECKDDCEIDPIVENCWCPEEIGGDVVSLRYFLGYVAYKLIPKLNCEICSAQLRKENELLTAPSELFICNKNYSSVKDFGSLIAPSQLFFEVSAVYIKIFKKIFYEEPHKVGIKAKIIEMCTKASPEWFNICSEHKQKVLNFLILVLLRKHCIWLSQENTQNKKEKK